MTGGMLDLSAWVTRLITDVPAFRVVGLAADLVSVTQAPRDTPQAFVVPVSDSPTQRAGPGNSVISQNVTATVAIVVAVSNQRAAIEGAAAAEDIQVIRRAILKSLHGWKPPGASHAIQYAGGIALPFADSTAWFSDRYATGYFVRTEFAT